MRLSANHGLSKTAVGAHLLEECDPCLGRQLALSGAVLLEEVAVGAAQIAAIGAPALRKRGTLRGTWTTARGRLARTIMRISLPVFLAALILGLPACGARPPATHVASPAAAANPRTAAEHGPEAEILFMVLCDGDREKVAAAVQPERLTSLIQPRHCGDGPSCEAVRASIRTRGRFEAVVLDAAEIPILPEIMEHARKQRAPEALERTRQLPRAVLLRFNGPAFPHQVPARAAFAATSALAENLSGFVVDPVAPRIEGSAEFAVRAITVPWESRVPVIKAVTVHVVHEPGSPASLDTAGLSRFGLPELEIPEVQLSNASALGKIMNAVAFRLLADHQATRMSLSLEDIASSNGATPDTTGTNRQASVTVLLRPVDRQLEDEVEHVLQVTPESGVRPEDYEKLVADLFGSEDHVTMVKHDAELLAASKRAKAALPKVLSEYRKRGETGASLNVKLPFAVPGNPGQNEYMWVEVVSWTDTTIEGYLENDPEFVPDLRAGMRVSGKLEDVFDYLLRHADGSTEGGETIEILRRAQPRVQ